MTRQLGEMYSNVCFLLADKYPLMHLLFGVLAGVSPLLSEANYIDVDIVGGYVYAGLIRLTQRNSSQAAHSGFLCDDGTWSFRTAELVCKQAGHIDVRELLHDAETKYGTHSSDSYLHGLTCGRNAKSLSECSYGSWSEERCTALAGVQCTPDRHGKSSDIYPSFIVRVFMSVMFFPLCTICCVVCRCVYRQHNERRRLTHTCSFPNTHRLSRTHEIRLDAFADAMPSDNDLPSYDQILKDTSNNFRTVNSNRTDEDENEEPPPSYDSVIGSWSEHQSTSVT